VKQVNKFTTFLLFVSLISCAQSPNFTGNSPQSNFEFTVTSPQEGAVICQFANLSIDSSQIDDIVSVEFQFNDSVVATDADGSDGFSVPFFTEGREQGQNQISARVVSRGGAESTQTVNVTISSGEAAEEVSQAEFEDDTGIDFEARSLRFLGAQRVSDNACNDELIFFDFGDDVAAGEEIIQWGSLPDQDGDNVDELIAINTGVVNSQGDIVVAASPDVRVFGDAEVSSENKNYTIGNLFEEGISAGAGAIVTATVSGYPIENTSGTLAIFESLEDGEVQETTTYLHYDATTGFQALIFHIPRIAVGNARLTIVNENLGFVSEAVDVTVESLPALTRTPEVIINEFYEIQLASTRASLENVTDSVTNAGLQQILQEYADRQIEALVATQEAGQELLADYETLPPELQQAFTYQAQAIENSRFNELNVTGLSTTQIDCSIFEFLRVDCPNPDACSPPTPFTVQELNDLFQSWLWPLPTLNAATACVVPTQVCGVYSSFEFAYGAARVVATLWGNVAEGFFYIDNVNEGRCSEVGSSSRVIQRNQDKPSLATTSSQDDFSQYTYVGMAAVVPTGGEVFGGAAVRDETGTCQLTQEEGRTLIKVAFGNDESAFDGQTDQEGFFSIQGIPEGQTYTATAIDTQTDTERVFRGTGVAVGQVDFVYFDFCDQDFDPAINVEQVLQTDDFEVTVTGRVEFDVVTTLELVTVQINDQEVVDVTDQIGSDGSFSLTLSIEVVGETNSLRMNAFTENGRLASFESQFAEILFLDWTQESSSAAGDWVISEDGRSVIQRVNTTITDGLPTFFISPEEYLNVTIRGSIEVREDTTDDDDWIGFVFGYRAPLAANGDTIGDLDFLLFDWKRRAQELAREGFSLLRVQGNLDRQARADCFYAHIDEGDCDILATRYSPQGEGWEQSTTYQFELRYSQDRIRIFIDNEEIFDVSGDFPRGRFGFYNMSQPGVFYSNFTVGDLQD
jgi:hypothetical protein